MIFQADIRFSFIIELSQPPANFFPAAPISNQPATSNSNTSSSTGSTAVPSQAGSQSSHTTTSSSLISRLCLESYKRDQDSAISDKREWSWEESQSRLENSKAQDATSGSTDQNSNALKDRKAKMVLESRW